MMSEHLTNKFLEALRTLEESKDAEPLAALFGDEAKVGNVISPDRFHGPAGAREFWTEYRGTFDQAKSEFQNVIVSDGRAALEWTTEGTSFDGKPVRYAGVTILEIAGEKITRSVAYFDPGALGRQMEK